MVCLGKGGNVVKKARSNYAGLLLRVPRMWWRLSYCGLKNQKGAVEISKGCPNNLACEGNVEVRQIMSWICRK